MCKESERQHRQTAQLHDSILSDSESVQSQKDDPETHEDLAHPDSSADFTGGNCVLPDTGSASSKGHSSVVGNRASSGSTSGSGRGLGMCSLPPEEFKAGLVSENVRLTARVKVLEGQLRAIQQVLGPCHAE